MNKIDEIEILLVEDNADDLDMTLRALRKANLANKIHTVRDGAEALEFIYGEGAHVGRSIASVPKLILLDLKLPKVDGLEVLRAIRADKRTQLLPVVVMTSSQEQRDLIESYKLGVNSYVVKPVDFDAFSAAVTDLGHYWLLVNKEPQ